MVNNPEIRVFLDTNVWFSGIYSSKNAPSIILRHFVEGRIQVVISQLVLDELVRTLRLKFPQGMPALNSLLTNSKIEIIEDPELAEIQPWAEILDFADAVIFSAAVSSGVEIFVSGDNQFLKNPKLNKQSGLHIYSPAAFLKRLE
jgi:putative PIN family toxin of toxin-antitoxin system